MCADRCFSNPTESNSSSDYTRSTKQKTIFKDVVNQVQGQTNFIKNNGVNYNENFGLHNNCLAFAKSYDLLLDVTKGKYYTTPVEDPNWVSNESWSAGLYSVNYSANGVNTVVDTSYNAGNGNHIIFPMTQSAELADISWNGLYPGVRVDPSYNIFYNECKDQNYWREKLVDISFNNTNYYIQSKQQSEQLYGMYYPANVSFECNTCVSFTIEQVDTFTGGVGFIKVGNTYTTIIGLGIGPNFRLIIPNGYTLIIPLGQFLLMANGSSILIEPGGTLTVNGSLNSFTQPIMLPKFIYNKGTFGGPPFSQDPLIIITNANPPPCRIGSISDFFVQQSEENTTIEMAMRIEETVTIQKINITVNSVKIQSRRLNPNK
jgi:hypothetical protein